MNTQTAFPLSWPTQWPRTEPYKRRGAPFHRHSYGADYPGNRGHRTKLSMNDAVDELYRNLRLIGVGDYNVIVSTNVQLRLDGVPYSNRAAPSDPGAAIFFKLKGKPCVLACDKWNRVEDNLSAIARHIEALRGQERWGVGSVEQAFAGYTALPPAGHTVGRSWWDILGCAHDAPYEVARDAFREKARAAHPDSGGSNEAMALINGAWSEASTAFQRGKA